MDRREFLVLGGTALAGGVVLGALIDAKCNREIDPLETLLLKDFLTYGEDSSIDRQNISGLLFDIEAKEDPKSSRIWETKGRAVNIGNGYYLTAYHVVEPKSGSKEVMRMIPQSRRGYVVNDARTFELASFDKTIDLALLKAPVEKAEGKAVVHLGPWELKEGNLVSTFTRFTGRPKQADYNFELQGVDFYDKDGKMRVGRLYLPAGSLLFQVEGSVLPYKEEEIKKIPGSGFVPAQNANFSSMINYNGDSGAPVFVQLRDGKYALVGIVTSGVQIEHSIKTPGHPLGYDATAQIGTIFAHRDSIERLIKAYNPDVTKQNLK
ncbi:hypothetical protein HYY70_06980 [Candidatus Woesearchaeota archaeon]|nr:hypothetical protein [Candidatus Woesearchaeota archaeon]